MKIELKSWTGTLLFTCEVDAALSVGRRIGFAIRAAVSAGADLSGADLSGADLSGADLSGADLSGADLSGAVLRNADLSGADLSGAVLSGADLSGADLSGAVLRNAVLRNAVLSGAVLRNAVLSGAVLRNAVLSGAVLSGAVSVLDVGTPHGWRIAVVRHDDGVRIAAGCRWMTFSAAVDYWKGQGDRKPLSGALLAYIKAAVAIKGWVL